MTQRDAHPHAPQRAVWVHRLTTLFVWAVVLVLFLRFFDAATILLLGVLAAACLAATIRPIMKRAPGSRPVRAVLAGLVPAIFFATLIFGIGWAMKGPIKQEMREWPQVKERLNGTLDHWGARFGVEDAPDVDQLMTQLRGVLVDQQFIATTTHLLTAVLIGLAFIFFGSIFILIERERCFLEPVLRMLPPQRRPQLMAMVDDLEPKLRWWLIGTLISMAVVGVLSGIGYSLAGLEFAIPLALLAGLAEIAPTVGPTFALIIALLLGLSQGTSATIGVIVVYGVVQMIESYLLLPYVMKKAVKIPPLVTLFTVVLWGKVFGAAGLFLAIPINLVIWAALSHFVRHEEDSPRRPADEKMNEE